MQSAQQTNARDLLLLWALWLLGSWTIAYRLSPVPPAADWMIYACMIGLMIMWPVLRLSQELDSRAAVSQILWDWLCLNLVFQAVVWPLQVSARWSTGQAVWIDAAVASWSLLIGAVLVFAGRRPTGLGRSLAMLLCIAVVVVEPLMMVLLNGATPAADPIGWTLVISPIDVLHDLLAGESIHPWRVGGIAVAAVAGWFMLGFTSRSHR